MDGTGRRGVRRPSRSRRRADVHGDARSRWATRTSCCSSSRTRPSAGRAAHRPAARAPRALPREDERRVHHGRRRRGRTPRVGARVGRDHGVRHRRVRLAGGREPARAGRSRGPRCGSRAGPSIVWWAEDGSVYLTGPATRVRRGALDECDRLAHRGVAGEDRRAGRDPPAVPVRRARQEARARSGPRAST